METIALRPHQPLRRADKLEITLDGLITREDQVVAVINRPVDLLVVVGTAASPGLSRGLIDDDALSLVGKRHRRRQAG